MLDLPSCSPASNESDKKEDWMLSLILLILALICFFCAAIGVPQSRVNLVALGLFLWVLTLVLGSAAR